MAEDADCQGEPYTGEEHAQHSTGEAPVHRHTGEGHAAAEDVLARMAILSGEKKREHGGKRGSELSLQIHREASSRLSQEVLSFSQMTVLTAYDYKEHPSG